MRDTSKHNSCFSSGSLTKPGFLQCRICGSELIIKRGVAEFFVGYTWPVYDCDDCGCRFTQYDSSTYDLLYSEQGSCYNRYTYQAEVSKALFDKGDVDGLRAELSLSSKYRFIIEQIDRAPAHVRILEIGSSLGHLTSYFILTGRNITGVDISQKAIAAATAAFGDHFVQTGHPLIEAQAPYDFIFHVGTIGCVLDPIGMTRRSMDLLRPGGSLLFNAPNRDGFTRRDQLWFDSAPPPDVVTLFAPGFWNNHFGCAALVSEEVEFCSPRENFLIALRRRFRRRWRKPIPVSLRESERPATPAPRFADRFWRFLESALCRAAQRTGQLRRAPLHPSEYGLFVRMIKAE
jgi:SAM-dependent methyltransferase